MSALPNHVLVEWMSDQKLGSRELAELVNKAVAELTGRSGGLDDSNIRAWRSGRVRCPKSVQLRALELVSGKSATDLGFERRTRSPATAPAQEEPPVLRRNLIQGAVAIAAAAATPAHAAPAASASPTSSASSNASPTSSPAITATAASRPSSNKPQP